MVEELAYVILQILVDISADAALQDAMTVKLLDDLRQSPHTRIQMVGQPDGME